MKSPTTFTICASLVMPFAALAQSADAKYCAALSAEYRKLNPAQSSGTEADAMAKCAAGDTATGIPILEKALKDAKVTLPPRN
jgi:hypothetical protein